MKNNNIINNTCNRYDLITTTVPMYKKYFTKIFISLDDGCLLLFSILTVFNHAFARSISKQLLS